MVPACCVMISDATVRMVRDPATSVAVTVSSFIYQVSRFSKMKSETSNLKLAPYCRSGLSAVERGSIYEEGGVGNR
jgi:hypothetical protein